MSKKRYVLTATAFDVKQKVLAVANNSYTKTHPMQAMFAKLAGEPHKQCLHAEILAMLRAGGKKIDSLLVTRYDSLGRTKNAKPCKVCELASRYFGVKTIRYTTEFGVATLNLGTQNA